MDPAAVTGDQHDSPTEIAINKEDLAVLRILANFTEVPNKIKHKQLRIMLDREKKGSPTTEFSNLLHSVPADEVGIFLFFSDFLEHNLKRAFSAARLGLGLGGVNASTNCSKGWDERPPPSPSISWVCRAVFPQKCAKFADAVLRRQTMMTN